MNYYITPPSFQSPYSKFLFKNGVRKHLTVKNWKDLVEWADREYSQAFKISVDNRDYRTAKILSREWSGMRILSGFDNFRWFCANLDEEIWNQLDRKTRKFITKAYELYELLRN